MLIVKTPLRLSLFGGSCDYKDYYLEHGPVTLIGSTINKYIYTTVRETPEIMPYHTLVNYSTQEAVSHNDDIKNPAVRGTLQFLDMHEGLEITHMSDLPARTGLGSSSAFIVGLLRALRTLRGFSRDSWELQPKSIALDAIEIERDLLGEPGGVQDQLWPNYAGLNTITLRKDGQYNVRPLPVSNDFKFEFEKSLCMFYLGRQRQSFKIAESHAAKHEYKHRIRSIAEEAKDAFYNEDIELVGRLLHDTWQAKKAISELISGADIDEYYQKALDLGAWGGKLLGTGGAGFLVFCIDHSKRTRLIHELGLHHIPFRFDTLGSRLIIDR